MLAAHSVSILVGLVEWGGPQERRGPDTSRKSAALSPGETSLDMQKAIECSAVILVPQTNSFDYPHSRREA